MRYFYTDTNRQPLGPEPREKILELLNSGVINTSSLVAEEGGKTWSPISSLLVGDATSAPPPIPTCCGHIALSVNTPPPVPVYCYRSTEPLAIWSLVLSLASLACCCSVFAFAGIICGHLARSKIKKNPHLDGDGWALAGLIIGYVIVLPLLLYAIIVAFCFFAGISAGFCDPMRPFL